MQAADDAGLRYRVIRHGPVRSLAEAAQACGVTQADVIKTLVVRRGDGDFLFVLVPGDPTISWPRLRALLAVSRLSLPDAGTTQGATGWCRGPTAHWLAQHIARAEAHPLPGDGHLTLVHTRIGEILHDLAYLAATALSA